jgi:hypothetical protein
MLIRRPQCTQTSEQRAMLAWIGDLVAQAGKPLERIHRLEVPAQQRIHLRRDDRAPQFPGL